ncbi:class I SAM-dependent methyltransferase [Deferrisoma camini]|uniref:class I SAM-dependent methyltransferase n=1 Tax=Deferrisoma camini TaxID=1035120 RepID=UPI00046CA0F5|nr:methyltransferase domain-containing protein [Deferrisoma camini]
MGLSQEDVQQIYRRRAALYDLTSNLYVLAGFRLPTYRRRAVEALGLRRGDTVVDIGCGTGLNLPLLRRAVGPAGRVVGVDLTDRMLGRARHRVRRHGWRNVDLVRCDAERYRFPSPLQGVLSTLAITLIPGYERVIRNAARALEPGRRLVVLDLKRAAGWPEWTFRLGVWLTRGFGVTVEAAERRPWEAMAACLENVRMEELYGGWAYLCWGEAPRSRP